MHLVAGGEDVEQLVDHLRWVAAPQGDLLDGRQGTDRVDGAGVRGELGGADDLQAGRNQGYGEVTKVLGDQGPRAADDRCCDDMLVTRVG